MEVLEMLLQRAASLLVLVGTLTVGGCSGNGPAVPTSPATAFNATSRAAGASGDGHGGWWMLPRAKNEDLVYASDMNRHKVFVLSLHGKLVGTFSFSKEPWGLCSDRGGDVFMTRSTDDGRYGVVTEFAHGSTAPIAELKLSYGASACAIDPITGDVAVSGGHSRGPVVIAVYSPTLAGPPLRRIAADTLERSIYVTYDDNGNLYYSTVSYSYGNRIYELKKKSVAPTLIENLTPREASGSPAGWRSNHLVFAAGGGDNSIEHIGIAGSDGRVTRLTSLEGTEMDFGGNQFCVDGSVVAAPFSIVKNGHGRNRVGIWADPIGRRIATFGGFGASFLEGITISRVPTQR
ncbi:MAG: hypothetical protein WBW76_16225 [Candidatus Cybelea sp.]